MRKQTELNRLEINTHYRVVMDMVMRFRFSIRVWEFLAYLSLSDSIEVLCSVEFLIKELPKIKPASHIKIHTL